MFDEIRNQIAVLERKMLEKDTEIVRLRNCIPVTVSGGTKLRFQTRLLRFRRVAGMSVADLSIKVGIKADTIYSWEAGKTLPNVRHVVMLCDALSITPNDLLI